VLGPIEIAWDGHPIGIGGVRARALIARFLVDRHIIVTVDRLVDSLWADNDGPGAEIALRSTISRLRRRADEAALAMGLHPAGEVRRHTRLTPHQREALSPSGASAGSSWSS